jgi:alkylation response protein AidB-like acyl-CoA dehydrogenase
MPKDNAAFRLDVPPSLEEITTAVGAEASERDADGHFPEGAFAALRAFGLVARPPLEEIHAHRLLRILAAIGCGDLSVGRIYEGHVNALHLIRQFGTRSQQQRFGALAGAGNIFGVWNTDHPGESLVLDGALLRGRKAFASGADGLSHAIVTVTRRSGRLMLLVPATGLPIDRTWWRPLGMRASGSHIVDFTGVRVDPDWILGRDDDYVREPWFSVGAVRFAAVHVGGMHSIFEVAVSHLRRAGRLADPHQSHRIARMGMAVEAGYAWLDRASRYVEDSALAGGLPEAAKRAIAEANATRLAIESLALSLIEEAERCVGAPGFIAPHPLERLIRDLRTYLRQPNPDGALTALGSSIAAGAWSPGHCFVERG